MDEPFLRFEWPVANAYEWRDWLDPRGKPVTVPSDGLESLASAGTVERAWGSAAKTGEKTGPVLGQVERSGIARVYAPMSRETATLFRTFAELDYRDLNAIAAFAHRYGLLGVEPQFQHVQVRAKTGPGRYHHAWGESHLDWAREICLMREALHLTRSQTALELEEDREDWNRAGLEPPYEERRRKLAWLLNDHLQHVQGRVVLEAGVEPRLSFAPLSLLSALWLQLTLSFVGGKEYRACKHCRRLFEISTENTGFRKHREFCSESCKTLDYRRRKRTALELASEGVSAAAIAAQIATERATVRAWLATKKRGKGKR